VRCGVCGVWCDVVSGVRCTKVVSEFRQMQERVVVHSTHSRMSMWWCLQFIPHLPTLSRCVRVVMGLRAAGLPPGDDTYQPVSYPSYGTLSASLPLRGIGLTSPQRVRTDAGTWHRDTCSSVLLVPLETTSLT
jgi:hypothetical protein